MYSYYEINGNKKLSGEIRINGAKNSSLPIIIATTLANDIITLEDVPLIEDVNIIVSILERMGSKINFVTNDEDVQELVIDNRNLEYKELVYEDVSKLRASYYFVGALIGKYKKVKILLPGGCFLGERPIDLHIKGLKALGCRVKIGKSGNFDLLEVTSSNGLQGTTIFLDFPSVGATINLILAAVYANGETIIENAAKEPEIVDVTTFLRNMGADIKGAGTDIIKIKGSSEGLKKCTHQIIPDRIEAGTYIMMGALLGDELTISNIIPEHHDALFAKLNEIGINMSVETDKVLINKNSNELKKVDVKTGVYPSFPTDLQQIITTLLTQVPGESRVEDFIYADRFRNCDYLNLMGAKIKHSKKKSVGKALIKGETPLNGQEVIATDLRAGASLVFAGLLASGTTKILDINHILRGYYKMDEKLRKVGADIKLIEKDV